MAGNRAVIIGAGAVIVIGLLWVVYRGAPDMHPAAPGVSASKPSTPSSQPVRPSNPPSAPQTETNATTAPTASPALPAAPAIKASFDCSKAVINAEKIICADASLAAMDVELDSLFKRARARTTDPSTLDSDQGAWLENRNACASRSCLRSAYAEREEDVRRWLAQ